MYLLLSAGLECDCLELLDYAAIGERLEVVLTASGLVESVAIECHREALLLDIATSRLAECVPTLVKFADSEGLECYNPEADHQLVDVSTAEVEQKLAAVQVAAAAASSVAELPEIQLSAARGQSRAICELGSRYFFGEGVELDLRRGADLYRQAAELGNLDAAYNLATCYLDGHGVIQSVQEAVGWFRRAAEAGDPFAALRLGELYSEGRHVQREISVAERYFMLAHSLGHQDARKKLRSIGSIHQP